MRSARHENESPGVKQSAEPERKSKAGNVSLGSPIGRVGADRFAGKRHQTGAAIKGAARLIETHMTVRTKTDNGEIDTAAIGDHLFDSRRFRAGIGARRIECVNAILGNAQRLQQFAPKPQRETPAVVMGYAGILIKRDKAHAGEIGQTRMVSMDKLTKEPTWRLSGRKYTERPRLPGDL